MAAAIASGAIADPGVFASEVRSSRRAPSALFVLATFWLAYYTARQLRAASLAAIDDHGARPGERRGAPLMDELLGDLERAARGPDRHTDRVIGSSARHFCRSWHVSGSGARSAGARPVGAAWAARSAHPGSPADFGDRSPRVVSLGGSPSRDDG
jgi:hypothetical protein